MLYISIHQLLTVWNQLDDAYYENNGFGTDTAEIYAYTVSEDHPARRIYQPTDNSTISQMKKENAIQSRKTMCEILETFANMRMCSIMIDDGLFLSKINDKITRTSHPFWEGEFHHRIHVRVIKDEKLKWASLPLIKTKEDLDEDGRI
jgi:hypothetical protein